MDWLCGLLHAGGPPPLWNQPVRRQTHMSAMQVKKPMRVTFFSSGVMEEGVDQGGMTLCMSGGGAALYVRLQLLCCTWY